MKKINVTIATIALVLFTTVLLTSCHRNTCPTYGKVDTNSEVRI